LPEISKPKIAITGPNISGSTAWFFTALNIGIAGGKPVRVTPESFDGTFDYDGIIIGGGSDIHPDHYIKEGSTPVERSLWLKLKECVLYPMELMSRLSSSEYDKTRDVMEIRFIQYALDNNLPILGICRGHQLLNAELGGTMYESTLPLLEKDARIRSPFPRKTVLYTTNDSLISRIAGDDPLKVNAIHSQAVAQPAEDLKVTAKEEVGINQVIESKNSDKVLGVQWHPEYLFYMKAHRKIFSWLVREAKK
tara:strand:+ start:666 stop:1418 length:753 start_codon:yes stop_codon:yes gene_type:complete